MSTVRFHLYATMSSGCQNIYVGELTHECSQCCFDILTQYCTKRGLCYQHTPREPLFLLMHIANTFTRECTRVLRPASGRFVVTCPSLNVKTFTEPTMYSALKASRKHFSAVTRGPEQQFCMHFVSVFFYVFSGLFLVLLH